MEEKKKMIESDRQTMELTGDSTEVDKNFLINRENDKIYRLTIYFIKQEGSFITILLSITHQ